MKSQPGPCRPRESGNSGQEEPGPDTRELPHLPMSLLSQICNRREKSAFISLKSLLFCVSVRTAAYQSGQILGSEGRQTSLRPEAAGGQRLCPEGGARGRGLGGKQARHHTQSSPSGKARHLPSLKLI